MYILYIYKYFICYIEYNIIYRGIGTQHSGKARLSIIYLFSNTIDHRIFYAILAHSRGQNFVRLGIIFKYYYTNY